MKHKVKFTILLLIFLSGCSNKKNLPIDVGIGDHGVGEFVHDILINDKSQYYNGEKSLFNWNDFKTKFGSPGIKDIDECVKNGCGADNKLNSAKVYAIYYLSNSYARPPKIEYNKPWWSDNRISQKNIILHLSNSELFKESYAKDKIKYNIPDISQDGLELAIKEMRLLISTPFIEREEKIKNERIRSEQIIKSPRVKCNINKIQSSNNQMAWNTIDDIVNKFISIINSNNLTCKTDGPESLSINGRVLSFINGPYVYSNRDYIVKSLFNAVDGCQEKHRNRYNYAEYNQCTYYIYRQLNKWIEVVSDKKMSDRDFYLYTSKYRIGPSYWILGRY